MKSHNKFVEEVQEITRPKTVEERTRKSLVEDHDALYNSSEGGEK